MVKSIEKIPVAGSRSIAYIRGRLIDKNGQPVRGTEFTIWSDTNPPWTATEPSPEQADGTVVFVVTRGRFAVRVVGGRSQDAGWMVTGLPGEDTLSDFDFVFQTTR